MMLEAGTLSLRQQCPNGCLIYDARGRLLRMVLACNPETGEVIRYETINNGKAIATNADGSPRKRHGFWPAPLRVVPLGGPVPAGVPCRVGDGTREQWAAIDAIEESIRPMLKRGEWLDAWRGINR